jgi:hypothetical protein
MFAGSIPLSFETAFIRVASISLEKKLDAFTAA